MFSPHWDSWAHAVLIQNLDTNAIRVYWLPIDDARNDGDFVSGKAAEQAFLYFTKRAIEQALQPDERVIEIADYFALDEQRTNVKCPQCSEPLRSESRGIS